MTTTILGLFSVGIVTAAIGILGFAVFLDRRRSATNRAFFLFSLVTIAYIVLNYISYAVTDPSIGLILFRVTIFFAAWHAFYIFRLLYIFPAEEFRSPRWLSAII